MYSRTSSKKVSASHASLEVGWLAYRWRQVHLLGLASVRKKVKKGKDPSCDDGPDRVRVGQGRDTQEPPFLGNGPGAGRRSKEGRILREIARDDEKLLEKPFFSSSPG